MDIINLAQELNNLDELLSKLLAELPSEVLYHKPVANNGREMISIGELIIEIGQVQEYLFQGLSVNFWDHPHEWSNRESLATNQSIIKYLQEVALTRKRALAIIGLEDLKKKVYLPDREAFTIEQLLLKMVMHIADNRGQIYVYTHLFSNNISFPAINSSAKGVQRLI